MASHLIGYQSGRGFLYQLSGASKLIFFVLVSVACMTTYDTRLIAVIGIASLVLFKIAGIRWQQVSFVVKFIGFFAFLMWSWCICLRRIMAKQFMELRPFCYKAMGDFILPVKNYFICLTLL